MISTCAVGKPLDRVVGAAVALEHLGRLAADRQRQHLVAKADAEQGLLRFQHLLDHGNRIFAGCGRIARAVRQEEAVGLVAHHLVEADAVAGKHRNPRASLDQVAEDVALGAIVDRDDMRLRHIARRPSR